MSCNNGPVSKIYRVEIMTGYLDIALDFKFHLLDLLESGVYYYLRRQHPIQLFWDFPQLPTLAIFQMELTLHSVINKTNILYYKVN